MSENLLAEQNCPWCSGTGRNPSALSRSSCLFIFGSCPVWQDIQRRAEECCQHDDGREVMYWANKKTHKGPWSHKSFLRLLKSVSFVGLWWWRSDSMPFPSSPLHGANPVLSVWREDKMQSTFLPELLIPLHEGLVQPCWCRRLFFLPGRPALPLILMVASCPHALGELPDLLMRQSKSWYKPLVFIKQVGFFLVSSQGFQGNLPSEILQITHWILTYHTYAQSLRIPQTGHLWAWAMITVLEEVIEKMWPPADQRTGPDSRRLLTPSPVLGMHLPPLVFISRAISKKQSWQSSVVDMDSVHTEPSKGLSINF